MDWVGAERGLRLLIEKTYSISHSRSCLERMQSVVLYDVQSVNI